MKLFWKVSGLSRLTGGTALAALLLAGCSSGSNDLFFSDSPQPPAMTGAAASLDITQTAAYADRLRVGETVLITLFSSTADPIPVQTMPITENGTITLPLIGPVAAAGKTPGELQTEIHNLYVPRYYVRLTVTVSSDQRVYYVGGEVKAPGRQLYLGQTTVTKAIQAAGDFTDFANKSKVWLTRANGERMKVNCNKALTDPSQDPPVYPGDQILVKRRIW